MIDGPTVTIVIFCAENVGEFDSHESKRSGKLNIFEVTDAYTLCFHSKTSRLLERLDAMLEHDACQLEPPEYRRD